MIAFFRKRFCFSAIWMPTNKKIPTDFTEDDAVNIVCGMPHLSFYLCVKTSADVKFTYILHWRQLNGYTAHFVISMMILWCHLLNANTFCSTERLPQCHMTTAITEHYSSSHILQLANSNEKWMHLQPFCISMSMLRFDVCTCRVSQNRKCHISHAQPMWNGVHINYDVEIAFKFTDIMAIGSISSGQINHWIFDSKIISSV